MSSPKPSGAAPRSRGRPRGDSDCRERLILAALSAFTHLGYDGAGLRAIAQEAGCDVSMVAHHFGSKAGLWQAVVDRVIVRHEQWLAGIESMARGGAPLAERLSWLLDSMMEGVAEVPNYVRFVTREIAEAGKRRDYLVEKLVRPGLEACLPLWRDAMAAGLMRHMEPAVLQVGLFGAIAMLMPLADVIAQLSGGRVGPGELKAELRRGLLGGPAAAVEVKGERGAVCDRSYPADRPELPHGGRIHRRKG